MILFFYIIVLQLIYASGVHITQMMGNMDTFNNTFLTLYKNYLTRHFELERNKNVAFTQYFEKRKIFYNN